MASASIFPSFSISTNWPPVSAMRSHRSGLRRLDGWDEREPPRGVERSGELAQPPRLFRGSHPDLHGPRVHHLRILSAFAQVLKWPSRSGASFFYATILTPILIAFNSVLNPHLLSALWLQLSQNVPRNDHGIANPFVLRTKLKKCYAKNTLVFDMGGIYPLFTPFSTCMALGCASS